MSRPAVVPTSWPVRTLRELDELEGALEAGGFVEAVCACGAEPVGRCDGCGDLTCRDHLTGGGEILPTLCVDCAPAMRARRV